MQALHCFVLLTGSDWIHHHNVTASTRSKGGLVHLGRAELWDDCVRLCQGPSRIQSCTLPKTAFKHGGQK